MLFLKKSTDVLVPVMLTDASTGDPFTGVAYTSVAASVIKNDGTVVDLGALGPTDWTEVTTGAYSTRGYYLLKLPASALDQEGILHYGVGVTGAEFYPGSVNVRGNTEKEVYDRIGAPVGASLSADIQDISAGIGGEGGFGSQDRSDLLAVKAKTDLLPADPASNSHVDSATATNGFSSSDRSNLGAIKTKTDNLPTTPASQSDVTSARDNVNTNTNSRATELKGTSWSSTNDTMHQLRTQIDAVKAKTDLLPADPASESVLKGVGFDPATDTLHQLALAIDSVATGGGSGFGSADRADLQAVKAKTDLLPADPAGQAATIAGVLGSESVFGAPTARTVSETYVRVRNNVEPKTNNLPADPASNTVVNARATEIKGSGFTTGDDLHTIRAQLGAGGFIQADRDLLNSVKTELDTVKSTGDSNRTDILGVRGKTDNLPVDPASNTHIDTVMGAGANAFTSEDHDLLVSIEAKTQNLPPDPAAQSAGFGSADRDVASAIRAKTDLLPPDPASNTSITALSNKVGTPKITVATDISSLTDVVIAGS